MRAGDVMCAPLPSLTTLLCLSLPTRPLLLHSRQPEPLCAGFGTTGWCTPPPSTAPTPCARRSSHASIPPSTASLCSPTTAVSRAMATCGNIGGQRSARVRSLIRLRLRGSPPPGSCWTARRRPCATRWTAARATSSGAHLSTPPFLDLCQRAAENLLTPQVRGRASLARFRGATRPGDVAGPRLG